MVNILRTLGTFIAALVGVTLSGSAQADWRQIPLPEGENVSVDMSSLRRQGSIVDISFLHDFPSSRSVGIGKRYFPAGYRQSFHYMSELFGVRFNCQTAEFQSVSLTLYSEHMGQGASYVDPGPGPTNTWITIKKRNQAWNEVYALVCNR
jgi:hypothetical protein